MSFPAEFWSSNTFCVVSGASKGIGQRIALDFSKKMKDKSTILLLARGLEGLEKTKEMISITSPEIKVFCHSVNLQDVDIKAFKEILVQVNSQIESHIEHALIVHNAGSIGKMDVNVLDMDDPEYFRKYYDLNVNSMLCLNAAFFKLFSKTVKRTIVNITSLAAVSPFSQMGYYCGGKALREAMLRNLAIEDPTIKILNYAPGPVETDMLESVLKDAPDTEFKKSLEQGTILTCEQTVKRLIGILESDRYCSGDRIDYFDA